MQRLTRTCNSRVDSVNNDTDQWWSDCYADAPNRLFVEAASRATFSYLQRGISKQLEKLYPTRPHNADAWLNNEIFRASCDPCALQVRASQAVLPPSNACAFECLSVCKRKLSS